MRRKVILVNPRMCSPGNFRLPLSLLALASVLEDKHAYQLVDGNVDGDAAGTVRRALDDGGGDLVGISVMPGPQVAPAIEIAAAVRAAHPHVPIAWGGYFPTLYPDAAINAPYVDYVVRGQGEQTLPELLERLPDASRPGRTRSTPAIDSAADSTSLHEIAGLTWKVDGRIVHNPERSFRPPDGLPPLPYERLGDVGRYLRPSFMGTRTGVHQAAIGCRYRCAFCGVVSMFNGSTLLQSSAPMAEALYTLRDRYGANAIQFYDNNFFDREETSLPLIETLVKLQMPWWCYARADTLAGFSGRTWELLRRSRFRMAFMGAEAASDDVLRRMKKGTRVGHTLEAAARCRAHGVIPEFSFVLGGPEDPEGEIEKTFRFIKRLKQIHPGCEIILYFYSPTPQRELSARKADISGVRLPVLRSYGPDGPQLPTTPEEWTQPRWIDFVCHRDAPWLTSTMRERVKDFGKVLGCRFPTVQDYATPRWGKTVLKTMASWRYATGCYGRAWELDLARRLIPLREPQRDSL